MDGKVDVVFQVRSGCYQPGDRAGFPLPYAEALVKKRVAVIAEPRPANYEAMMKAKQEAEQESRPDKIDVVFVKRYRMYQPADKAGFDPRFAKQLVSQKIAVLANPPKPEEEEPEEEANGDIKPSWGPNEKPTLEQFIAYYSQVKTKKEILEDLPPGFEVDPKMGKTALLTAIYKFINADKD